MFGHTEQAGSWKGCPVRYPFAVLYFTILLVAHPPHPPRALGRASSKLSAAVETNRRGLPAFATFCACQAASRAAGTSDVRRKHKREEQPRRRAAVAQEETGNRNVFGASAGDFLAYLVGVPMGDHI